MDEIRKLVKELLAEMEMLTPECVEEFRAEWIGELEHKDPERRKKLEGFVNSICDYGMAVAERKAVAV